jgi:hypothetical protein
LNEKVSINLVFIEYARFSDYLGIKINKTKFEVMRLNNVSENFVSEVIEVDTNDKRFKLKTVSQI